MSKYTGAINEELFKLFLVDDGFTVGQKLAQIEKTAEKRLAEIEDKELYETIQEVLKTDYYSDEELSEEEFNKWRDK